MRASMILVCLCWWFIADGLSLSISSRLSKHRLIEYDDDVVPETQTKNNQQFASDVSAWNDYLSELKNQHTQLKPPQALLETSAQTGVPGVNTVMSVTIGGTAVHPLEMAPSISRSLHKISHGKGPKLSLKMVITLHGGGARQQNDKVFTKIGNQDFVDVTSKIEQDNTIKLDVQASAEVYIFGIKSVSAGHTEEWKIQIQGVEWGSPAMGLEYEIGQLQIRFANPSTDTYAVMHREDTLIQTAKNELGLPNLMVQFETPHIPNPTNGGIELVTGAAAIGEDGPLPSDIKNMYHAIALFLDAAKQVVTDSQLCPNTRAWTLFSHVFVKYNKLVVSATDEAVPNSKKLFAAPDKWQFKLDNHNEIPLIKRYKTQNGQPDFSAYRWQIFCGWDYVTGVTNTQVNFGLPLVSLAPVAHPSYGNPSHYVDLYPDATRVANSDDPVKNIGKTQPAVQRALFVAHNLVFGNDAPEPFQTLRNNPKATMIDLYEVRGMIAAFFLHILYQMNRENAAYLYRKKNVPYDTFQIGNTGGKNLAVNLMKSSIVDVLRLLEPISQTALSTFFKDKSNNEANINFIVEKFLAQQGQGSVDYENYGKMFYNNKNAKDEPLTLVQEHQAQVDLFKDRLKENIILSRTVLWTPSSSKAARYTGETDEHFGTAIKDKKKLLDIMRVAGYILTSISENAIIPYRGLGWGKGVGVVVESRLDQSTLNLRLAPSDIDAMKQDQFHLTRVTGGIAILRSISQNM